MIQIFVRTFSGKTHVIRVATDETVADIKDRIQKIDGSPVSHQRLQYIGEQLCDELTLADYDVQQDSTLHVNSRLRGGGNIFSTLLNDIFCGGDNQNRSTPPNNYQRSRSSVTPSHGTPTQSRTGSTNNYSNSSLSLNHNSGTSRLNKTVPSLTPAYNPGGLRTNRTVSSTPSTSTHNSISSHTNKTVSGLTSSQSPAHSSGGLRTNRTTSLTPSTSTHNSISSHANKTVSGLTPSQSSAYSSGSLRTNRTTSSTTSTSTLNSVGSHANRTVLTPSQSSAYSSGSLRTNRTTSSTTSTSTLNSIGSHANRTALNLTSPQSPAYGSGSIRTNRTISSTTSTSTYNYTGSHANKTVSGLTSSQSSAHSSGSLHRVGTISLTPSTSSTRSSINSHANKTVSRLTPSSSTSNANSSSVSRTNRSTSQLTLTPTTNTTRSYSTLTNNSLNSLNIVSLHSVVPTKQPSTYDYDPRNEIFTEWNEWSVVKLYLNLPHHLLAPQYDYDFTNESDDGELHTRGRKIYRRPYGFMRFALNVRDKYPGGNAWIGDIDKRRGTTSIPNEWLVSYHGTTVENIRSIVKEGFDRSKCVRDVFEQNGIYSSPNIDVAWEYAQPFTVNGVKYRVILQNRINPRFVREVRNSKTGHGKYYVTRKSNDIRPYGICVKKDRESLY